MTAILRRKHIVSPDYSLYFLECKDIASAAQPGQFVEVRVSKGSHPAMRKPMSVFCTDGSIFAILVKNVGYGAELMKNWVISECVDVLGPLGRGFRYAEEDNDYILVAGGVGLAPLNFLSQKLVGSGKNVHILYAPKRDALLMDAFTVKTGVDIHFTENRSTVTGDLKRIITSVGNSCGVFTCGPNEFMKLVSDTASVFGLKTQASLETRMSCGIGVCLGCVVPVRFGDDVTYKTVCHDGPVFLAEEVVFE